MSRATCGSQAKVMRGRTELAKQLQTEHMVQGEDFREDVLPPSIDMDGKVKGAAKVSQLGDDALQKGVGCGGRCPGLGNMARHTCGALG